MRNILKRMRGICLVLPETKETLTWGDPYFRVGDKIFAGCGEGEDGRVSIGLKLNKPHAAQRCADDARFKRSKYVGAHGWVTIDASGALDWNEMAALIHESYGLVAPARLRKAVASASAGPTKKSAAKKPATKTPALKKPATKKPATKKSALKKSATKKSALKKSALKKSALKKSALKKSALKKSATKKSATKKSATKKSATKKSPTKKSATKRTR